MLIGNLFGEFTNIQQVFRNLDSNLSFFIHKYFSKEYSFISVKHFIYSFFVSIFPSLLLFIFYNSQKKEEEGRKKRKK